MKGLKNVQYVLLQLAAFFEGGRLSMYLPQGSDPLYVVARPARPRPDWPGRG